MMKGSLEPGGFCFWIVRKRLEKATNTLKVSHYFTTARPSKTTHCIFSSAGAPLHALQTGITRPATATGAAAAKPANVEEGTPKK